ncbi:MAG: transposase [Muribaculaceae bacterium]|nr:transposase [Muribaculaceae bacterium]
MMVFGVKHRVALIHPHWRGHLHSTVAKILNEHGKGSHCICVGGTGDHIHVFFSLSVNIAISDLAREVKSRSSRWINEHKLAMGHFEWQSGYAVFSYSQSDRQKVINYINNQEEHHRRRSFREEVEKFLELYNLVSDPRDLPKDLC